MLTCHFCDAELTDSLLQSGRCPNCGAQLRWQGVDQDAVATPRLRAGLDGGFTSEGSVKAGAAGQQDSSAAADASSAHQELPTHNVQDEATRSAPDDTVKEGGATPDAAGSSHDPDRPATLSPEMLARVTAVWSRSVDSDPDASPEHTIKAPSAGTHEDHALVIQTRRLGGYDRPLPPRSDYELMEIIGEGGVGVVYQARQNSIDRMVAVKMLKSQARDEESAYDKFLSEAVVTGELEHPNIVPIYDLGTNDDGALFYSMKRVVGTPWDVALPGNSLTMNIEILMKVCDAVAFAHSRGVVHRDLKPENVMLGGFGEVLVMDWGIAISTEPRGGQRDVRQSATMGGTPAYMAPEMATGPLERIGVASDVYLLAGILYEIVTGKTPHNGRTVMDCLYSAAANEIQPTDAGGELVEIARLGMATDPAERFQSVAEFQDAIRAYQSHSESMALSERAGVDLREAIRDVSYDRFARALFAYEEAVSLWPGNEPAQEGMVEARRSYAEAALNNDDYELGLSLVNRDDVRYADVYAALHAGQFEQQQRRERIRGLKWMAAGLALILVVSGTISYVQIRNQRTTLANQAEALEASEATLRTEKETLVRTQTTLENRKVELETAQEEIQQKVVALQTSEGALTATVANLEQEQRRKDYEKYVADIGLAAEQIEASSFQAAQRLLRTYEGTALVNYEWGRQEYLCRPLGDMVNAGGTVRRVQYLDDGRCFVATAQGQYGFDTDQGAEMHALPGKPEIAAVAISPDGHTLAVSGDDSPTGRGDLPARDETVNAGGDQKIHLYQIDGSGHVEQLRSLQGHTGEVTSLQFSPDGTKLLSTSEDKTAHLWDAVTGRLLHKFEGHASTVWQGAFAPHREGLLATAGQDGRVIVWEQTRGDQDASVGAEQTAEVRDYAPRVYYGHHDQPVYAVAFSPDGDWIASGGADGRVLVWRRDEAQVEDSARLGSFYRGLWPETDAIRLTGHRGAVRCLSFSSNPDDHWLLSGDDDNTLRLWNVEPDASGERLIAPLRGHSSAVTSCAMAPDGRSVLSGAVDGFWKRWDISEYRGRTLTGHTNEILAARLSRAASGPPLIVTAGRDHTARVWSGNPAGIRTTLQAGHEFLATSVLALPGLEDYAITSGGDNTARVWSLTEGQQLVLSGTGRRAALAVSRDGRWVLTGAPGASGESSARVPYGRLWRIREEAGNHLISSTVEKPLKPVQEFDGEAGVQVTAAAIDHDNQTYFLGDTRGVGHLWRSGEDDPVALIGHTTAITAAAFRPEGRLVVASEDPAVTQFDVASGTEIPALTLRHNGTVIGMSVSPDGRTALTTCQEKIDSPTTIGAVGDSTVVRLWNLDTATELWQLKIPIVVSNQEDDSNSATHLLTGFAPDGGRFFVGNLPGKIFQVYKFDWDGDSRWRPDVVWNIEAVSAWSAAFSDDGSQLITLESDSLQVWNIDTGVRSSSLRRQSVVSSVDVSPDGSRVVTASWDLEVRVWDANTGSIVHQLRNGDEGATFAVRFSPDGQIILTAGEYGIVLWNGRDYQRLNLKTEEGEDLVFNDAKHTVIAAEFSGDGQRIAGVCDDGRVRVWSLHSGSVVADVSPRKTVPTCCALGPFGRQLAAGTSEGGLVWTIGDDGDVQPRLKLSGHTGPVTSLAFSPDGRRMVSGSEDGTAKIWDVAVWDTVTDETTPPEFRDAKQLLTLSRHTEAVTAVDFSVDGTIVLTASGDGTAVLWESNVIPPSVGTSTSRLTCEASDAAVRVDPGLVINAPNTPLFDGVALEAELKMAAREKPENSETATGTVALDTTEEATGGSAAAGDKLTLDLDRQELPDSATGPSPNGKLFVLAGNGSALRISADDASLLEGERIVAEVKGLETTKLAIEFEPDARLPDVEAVARSIACRPASGHTEMSEMTVLFRITDSKLPIENGVATPPASVKIQVKAPQSNNSAKPVTAPRETHERA